MIIVPGLSGHLGLAGHALDGGLADPPDAQPGAEDHHA